MIIADSSVWIDFFNGIQNPQTDYLDSFLYEGSVHILDIILAEVLQGFRSEQDYRTAKELMLMVPCHNVLSRDLAILSADFYRQLKKNGITIRKTIDMLIAAWCIHNHVTLLENDTDFVHIAEKLPLKIVRDSQ
jgi:predicted nucleic acid-binding protein